MSDRDIKLLGSSRTTACFCPTTERDLADGIGPGPSPLRRPAARSPSARTSTRSSTPSRSSGGWRCTSVSPATSEGASRPTSSSRPPRPRATRSLGWEGAGRIAEGALADFVVVRTDTVNTAGARAGQVMYCANAVRHRPRLRRRRGGRAPRPPPHRPRGPTARGGARRSCAPAHERRQQHPRHRHQRARHLCRHRQPTPWGCATTPPWWRRGDGSPGSARAAALPRPTARSTSAAARSCPASSTRTPTSSSPATAPAEFAARMAGERYDGGGIGVSVEATRAASDDELRALVRGRVAEMRAQGTTTVEIKSGYGLTVDDEARSLRIAARVHPRDDLPGGPRGPGGLRRRPRGIPRPRHRADARGGGAVRAVDRRVLRAALGPRLHRGRGACRPRGGPRCGTGPEGPRQPARPGTWRAARRRARGRQRRPLHLPVASRRRGAGQRGGHHRGHAPAGSRVLDPLALPRRAAPARRRLLGRAGHRLQPGHLLLVVDALRHRPRRAGRWA